VEEGEALSRKQKRRRIVSSQKENKGKSRKSKNYKTMER
jgi:hypothetical protein